MTMFHGDDPAVVDLCWRATLRAALAGGILDVVSEESTDRILGVGLWFGPNSSLFGTYVCCSTLSVLHPQYRMTQGGAAAARLLSLDGCSAEGDTRLVQERCE